MEWISKLWNRSSAVGERSVGAGLRGECVRSTIAHVSGAEKSLDGVTIVRVIATDGSLLGDMPTEQALAVAEEQGVDLVEVGPRGSAPPLCRLLSSSDDAMNERAIAHRRKIERERTDPGSRFPARWRDVWHPIAEILMNDWDPIGVKGVHAAVDEYDAYVMQLHGMLERGTTADAIVSYLQQVQTEWMEMGKGDPVKLYAIAQSLLRWWSTKTTNGP